MQTGGNFWNNIKKQQVSTSATSATPYVKPKVSNTGIFSNLSKSLKSVKEKTKTGMSDVVHSVGISTDIDTFHSKQVEPVKLNYRYAESDSDIKAEKAKFENAKCKIYITCANAKEVKSAIKKKLDMVKNKFDMSSIGEINNQINNLNITDNDANKILKNNWNKFCEDLKKQIQKARQTESEIPIDLSDNKIEVKFQFTERTDFEKKTGHIIQINVVDESLTIEYTAMNSSTRKEKVKISDLCIYNDSYDITVECNLQAGGSKNRKTSHSIKGGATDDHSSKISSMSTSDLC